MHEQTVRVLEEVGIAFTLTRRVHLLEAAPPPPQALTARLPGSSSERRLATAPGRILLAGRDPKHDRYLGEGEPIVFSTDGTATYMYDDLTGEPAGRAARPTCATSSGSSRASTRSTWKLVLGCVRAHARPGHLGAAHGGHRPHREQASTCTRGCRTTGAPSLRCSRPSPAPRCTSGRSTRSRTARSRPLQHDKEMTEAELARAGVPIFVFPTPARARTGPMSVLGTCIVNMAQLPQLGRALSAGRAGAARWCRPVVGRSGGRRGRLAPPVRRPLRSA